MLVIEVDCSTDTQEAPERFRGRARRLLMDALAPHATASTRACAHPSQRDLVRISAVETESVVPMTNALASHKQVARTQAGRHIRAPTALSVRMAAAERKRVAYKVGRWKAVDAAVLGAIALETSRHFIYLSLSIHSSCMSASQTPPTSTAFRHLPCWRGLGRHQQPRTWREQACLCIRNGGERCQTARGFQRGHALSVVPSSALRRGNCCQSHVDFS